MTLVEQAWIGADVERLFLEFQGTAGRGLVDVNLAGFLPPARKTLGKPEPSQSNAAPPPPTKNSQGPS